MQAQVDEAGSARRGGGNRRGSSSHRRILLALRLSAASTNQKQCVQFFREQERDDPMLNHLSSGAEALARASAMDSARIERYLRNTNVFEYSVRRY
jgi:hypothetical protein